MTTVAYAKPCSNEQIRLQEFYTAALPDCRAYEQVSPVDKNLADAIGAIGLMQSSSSGERAAFVSIGPFPGIPGSSQFPTYLSTRHAAGGGEWATEGLLPATEAGVESTRVTALTKDLSEALISVGSSQFLFNTAESLLVPFPTVEVFSDATADNSRILFESKAALLPNAVRGVFNLYEWENGRLFLVGVLSEGEGKTPAAGAVAGPGGNPAMQGSFYTQGTLSEDGLRVSFTDLETGRIYMRVREPTLEKTIDVSLGPAPAEWRAATPDGSDVFYTEEGKLYRFNVNAALSNQPEEKGRAHEELSRGPAEVQGTLGISENGSYVYFVAKSVQSGQNAEGKKPVKGAYNLYEWHEGTATPVTYIATLSIKADESNWRDFQIVEVEGAANGDKSSRVTPDGKTLLFSSVGQVTKYNNNELPELYSYNTSSARLTCVSCNPSGQPAATGAYFTKRNSAYHTLPAARDPFLTRNLSNDGGRVFFQTKEALVPKDTNGLNDVYEWENGHLNLISSGQGDSEAYFGDASADGNNVFFFTRQPLVSKDQDDNVDLYDARVDGGIAAQNPVMAPPCVGEECHGMIVPSPVFGTPSSATFSGSGNPAPQPPPASSLTKAQKLAKALKACRRKPRNKRAGCETQARKRYAGKSTATTANKRDK